MDATNQPPVTTLLDTNTTFVRQIICAMETLSPNHADWQVPVTYRTMTAARNEKPRSGSNAG